MVGFESPSRTNPEAYEIPSTPLSTLRFDWLQVVVEEHKLRSREVGLALDGELIRPVSDL